MMDGGMGQEQQAGVRAADIAFRLVGDGSLGLRMSRDNYTIALVELLRYWSDSIEGEITEERPKRRCPKTVRLYKHAGDCERRGCIFKNALTDALYPSNRFTGRSRANSGGRIKNAPIPVNILATSTGVYQT
jgi:hypothetical protein